MQNAVSKTIPTFFFQTIPEIFAQNPKRKEKKHFFQRNALPQTFSQDTQNAVSTTLPKMFRRKSETLSLKVRKNYEFIYFSKECVCLECPSGYFDRNFNGARDNLSPKA